MRTRAAINAPHAPQHPSYDRAVDLSPPHVERSSRARHHPTEEEQQQQQQQQQQADGGGGVVEESEALLCVPVIGSNGAPLGVLQAAGKSGSASFDEDDELLLRLASEATAVAVQNAQVHAAVAGFSSSLLRLCRDVFSQPSAEEVLQQLCMWGKQLLGASEIRAAPAEALRGVLEALEASEAARVSAAAGSSVGGGGDADGGYDLQLIYGDDSVDTDSRRDEAEAVARRRAALARVLSGGGAVILQGADASATFHMANGAEGEGGEAGGGEGGGSLLLLPMVGGDPSDGRTDGRVEVVLLAYRGRDTSSPAFGAPDVSRFAPAMSLAALAFSKAAARERNQRAMLEVGQFTPDGSALQDMALRIRRRAASLANARSVALYLMDHENSELWDPALSASGAQMCWPIGTGLAGYAAATGRHELVTRARDHPKYNAEVDLKTSSSDAPILLVPILGSGSTVLGVLELSGKEGGGKEGGGKEGGGKGGGGKEGGGGAGDDSGAMSDSDIAAVVAFAGGVCAPLDNAMHYEKLLEASQLQHELLKLMKTLTSAISENAATNHVRAWLRKHINVDKATVFLVDRANRQLYFKVAERSRELRFPMSTGVAGHVASTGEVLNIPNAYDDARFNQEVDVKTGYCTKSILCVPLRTIDGKIIGVVQLINKLTGGRFDQDDVRVTMAVADLTATALQNCRIQAKAISQGSFFHACAVEDGTLATAGAVEARAVELLRCSARAYTIDDETEELVYRHGSSAADPMEQRLPSAANTALGHAYQTGEIANLVASVDERFCNELSERLGIGVQTALVVPLLRPDGKPCGVLVCANRAGGRRFAREDEAMARNLGLQAGSILYNVWRYERSVAESQRNDALLEVTRVLNSKRTASQLVTESLERARDLTGAERGALFLVDAKARQLYSKLADGVTEIRFPMKHGVAGWAVTNSSALNIKNAYEDERFNPEVDRRTGFVTRSILCTPILSRGGDVLGVTQMLNKRGGQAFGMEDERTVAALAQQVGVALDNARLFERASSLHKYLGGLQAHRDFQSTLRHITSTAATLLSCAKVCIYLHDRRMGQLVSRFTDGLADFAIHQDIGVPGAAFASADGAPPIQVDDPARSAVWAPRWTCAPDLRRAARCAYRFTSPARPG